MPRTKRKERTTVMLQKATLRYLDGLAGSKVPEFEGRSRSDIIDRIVEGHKLKVNAHGG